MTGSSSTVDGDSVLAIDRLDAYRVALGFSALATRMRVTPASLRDQLQRAAASIVLNVAEGVGRASASDQAHCFAVARGSAFECAAVLDILHARGALSAAAHREGRDLLTREVQMLTRLMLRGSTRASRQAHPA